MQLPQVAGRLGGRLLFKRAGIHLFGDEKVLTVNDLTSNEALPSQVRLADKLFIKWYIVDTTDPSPIELGTSSHPVFVTFGRPVPGTASSSFISLLYPATKAATGTGIESEVVKRI